jgi:hypothetical protein
VLSNKQEVPEGRRLQATGYRHRDAGCMGFDGQE